MRVMFSKENWKEKLNIRKSWKMAGQSLGQMSCWLLKVEMVMESVQKAQGCMLVKPPSMYLFREETLSQKRHGGAGAMGEQSPHFCDQPALRLRSPRKMVGGMGVVTCVYNGVETPSLRLWP